MIFFDAKSDTRITGTILMAIQPGWWIVKTDNGRKYRTASEKSWRKGDRVAVVAGQIVGAAGKAPATKTFKV